MLPGSGSWSMLGTQEAKANLAPVDGARIVEVLGSLPIFTWSYRSQSDSIRHIGPMAQDFHAAFGVGEDDQHISAVDADGVALSALQGVYQLLQERDAQVTKQQLRIKALEARVVSLEAALGADERPTRSLFDDPAAGWLIVGNVFLFGAVLLHRTRRQGKHSSE